MHPSSFVWYASLIFDMSRDEFEKQLVALGFVPTITVGTVSKFVYGGKTIFGKKCKKAEVTTSQREVKVLFKPTNFARYIRIKSYSSFSDVKEAFFEIFSIFGL